jgi:uncharacterized DUF497 family protein
MGRSFDLARTIFHDPGLLTVADLEHSEVEDRWFSVGSASNGVLISIIYLWPETGPAVTQIRLISARKAPQTEIRYYKEGS